MKKTTQIREQKETLLLVGEGSDELAFLNYLKSLLVPRGAGLVLTIKNAKGKGAKHVIEWTIRQSASTQYDKVAVLFDTDTDWSSIVEKQAKKHKIYLLKSEPCFEAMMLRILNITPELGSQKIKKQFAMFVNNDATESQNYSKYFTINVLKKIETTSKQLINF